MNLSAVSTPNTVTVGVNAKNRTTAPVVPVESGEDGAALRGHRGGGGHGHLRQALMRALQGMGASTRGKEGDGASSVKHDLAKFMHTLFDAVRDEASTTTSGSPATRFGAGLSALITDARQGKAPAALQSAFDRLAADLKLGTPSSAAPTSAASANIPSSTAPISTAPADAPAMTTSTTAATSGEPAAAKAVAAAATPPTASTPVATPASATATATTSSSSSPTSGLVALLSRLQQQLGYGTAASTRCGASTLGNTVDVTA